MLQAESFGDDDITATNDTKVDDYFNADYFTDDQNAQIRIDAVISVRIEITYTLNNVTQTKYETVGLFQFDNGDVYLYPTKDGGLSQTALDNLGRIDWIRIDSLVRDDLAGGDNLIYHDSSIVGTVICFTPGTLIETASGHAPVEKLKVGSLINTLDRGVRPIRWIGSRDVTREELQWRPQLRPIRISQAALGRNQPWQDLVVSPQHRILVRSVVAERMFGEVEVLVAAKHLLGCEGIEVAEDLKEVTYWHFMFDRHEIVLANGAATESMYTGPEAMKALDPEARREVLTLFPELATDPYGGQVPARPFVRARAANKLKERLLRNGKPLVGWR
ncbi:Hint domain-containing protein [Paracoccus sp. S1E-3]|nr:Hint domain-containing protein [Paracoccus sp. S1E-3]